VRLLTPNAACALACLTLAACEGGERASRPEAAAVSRAVDAVRNAPNADKSGPLKALRATACTVADICAVQSYCVAAYEQHVNALGLLAEAKASVATAPVASVAETVAAVQQGLARAKTLTDECATRQGEMARHYHVAR
jgi:hypothetical protein